MLRFDSPAAHLRSVAFLEGLSYVLLLFLAMPLKYLAEMPMAVRVVGSLHGALFVWLAILVLRGMLRRRRSLAWGTKIMIASLLPFGTFAIDGQLRQEVRDDKRNSQSTSSAAPGSTSPERS